MLSLSEVLGRGNPHGKAWVPATANLQKGPGGFKDLIHQSTGAIIMSSTKKAFVFNKGQEQAFGVLATSLVNLNTASFNLSRIEDQVLALLILFVSKFDTVKSKSREARELNRRIKALVGQECPNVAPGTLKLYMRIAFNPTTAHKLGVKPGTKSPKTVLKAFAGLKDNKGDENGRKLTMAGYFRKELPTSKGKKSKPTVVSTEIIHISPAAKDATSHGIDTILDVLSKNGCKLDVEQVSKLTSLIEQHVEKHVKELAA